MIRLLLLGGEQLGEQPMQSCQAVSAQPAGIVGLYSAFVLVCVQEELPAPRRVRQQAGASVPSVDGSL